MADALIDLLQPFKGQVETPTVDNGNEFAQHSKISKALGISVYFAQPYCAWQRGLNENTNGLLRQYFPKGTNFKQLRPSQLNRVEQRLNQRPRKCLDFRTPHQALQPDTA